MLRKSTLCAILALTICQYAHGQWTEISYNIDFIAEISSAPLRGMEVGELEYFGGMENFDKIFDSERKVLYCKKEEAYLIKHSAYIPQNPIEEVVLRYLFKDVEYWSAFSGAATSKFVVDGEIKSSALEYVVPEWSFTDKSKEINGYKCSLARTKLIQKRSQRVLEYEVWYTTDIDLPWGPELLLGLPGLVVQIKTEDRIISLCDIKYDKALPEEVTTLYEN